MEMITLNNWPMTAIAKKIRAGLALLMIVVFPAVAVDAFAWDGKCVGVVDGVTITVMHNGQEEPIRLHGIDCPEDGQDFGKRAKQFTSDMVFGKAVTIEQTDTDPSGRTAAIVYAGSQNVNEELIRVGLAWVIKKNCRERFCAYWKKLEDEARLAGTGLWAHSTPPENPSLGEPRQ